MTPPNFNEAAYRALGHRLGASGGRGGTVSLPTSTFPSRCNGNLSAGYGAGQSPCVTQDAPLGDCLQVGAGEGGMRNSGRGVQEGVLDVVGCEHEQDAPSASRKTPRPQGCPSSSGTTSVPRRSGVYRGQPAD